MNALPPSMSPMLLVATSRLVASSSQRLCSEIPQSLSPADIKSKTATYMVGAKFFRCSYVAFVGVVGQ